jgi:hypothetical protein
MLRGSTAVATGAFDAASLWVYQVKELRDGSREGGEGAWVKRHKMLLELLTRQLLKLDQFECSGAARERRKQVINRVNSLCEALEGMAAS